MKVNKARSWVFFIILFLNILNLYGCATVPKGDAFRPMNDVGDEESIIYIYWPGKSNGTDFTIIADKAPIGKLVAGSYIPFRSSKQSILLEAKLNFGFMKAGLLDVAQAKTTQLSINLTHDAKPIYVRCSPYSDTSGWNFSMPGLINQLRLIEINSYSGESEIQNCRLLQ
ncbi:MAG: hypothetical protein R2940_04440 [Syntrophotaleaceae bacterium]